jgi:hypothetical protein
VTAILLNPNINFNHGNLPKTADAAHSNKYLSPDAQPLKRCRLYLYTKKLQA